MDGDEVLAALVEWKPDTREFVVFTKADYQTIKTTLGWAGLQLDHITCLPIEIYEAEW